MGLAQGHRRRLPYLESRIRSVRDNDTQQLVFGRVWEERVPPICPECGYDLRSTLARRCPECGCTPTFAELRHAAKDHAAATAGMKNANDGLTFGAYAVALGYAALVADRVGLGLGLGLVVGFFCGIVAVGSGLRVFRVKRLPAAVTASLSIEPQFHKGAALALLGILLIALCLLSA